MFCSKCGSELLDDSQFCMKCGHNLILAPKPIAAVMETSTRSAVNPGTFVFLGLSLLTLFVCLAKGVVPIYFLEAVIWAALAWFWNKKNPVSQTASLTVLLLAVAIAAGEGYGVGQQSVDKQSYESGRKAGFNTGWEDGQTAGYASGYLDGLACASGVSKACKK